MCLPSRNHHTYDAGPDITSSFQSFHHSHSRGDFDSKPNNGTFPGNIPKKWTILNLQKNSRNLENSRNTPPKKKKTGKPLKKIHGSHLWMFSPFCQHAFPNGKTAAASERSHCRAASTGLTDLGRGSWLVWTISRGYPPGNSHSHGKSIILMVFTWKDGDFMSYVSFREVRYSQIKSKLER